MKPKSTIPALLALWMIGAQWRRANADTSVAGLRTRPSRRAFAA